MDSRPQHPNILVFLTDDHAGWAVHAAGTRELHTPSMDRIAAAGARFTRASCVAPVCSPARASFWTGTLPSWHGVHDHLNRAGGGHPGIGDQRTLAEELQDAGYRTGLVGKWHCHCGPEWTARPGFERWFSMAAGTNARFGPQPFFDGERRVEHHGHQAPMLTEQALAFLREQRGDARPFFLCVGYTDTHTPLRDAPARLVDHYRGIGHPSVPRDETPPAYLGRVEHRLDPRSEDGAERIAQYYAAVSAIDEQVGRLLDELDSLGLADDTVVVYTADHGHNTGHHGLVCKGNATTPQNFLEESIGIPLLVSGPGIAAGTVCHEEVDHCDSYAALLDLAGTRPGDECPRPGRSWLPLARGIAGEWPQRLRFLEYGNARMAADGRCKLIRRWPGPNGHFGDVLIDLMRDPRETRNRSDDPAYAGIRAELAAAIDAHFARYQHPERSGLRIAELPVHNSAEPWRRAAS